MKILFVVSEVEDLVKTGGLADVAKALPLALSEMGHDVRIVMPYYKQLAEAFSPETVFGKQTLFSNRVPYEFTIKQINLQNVPVLCVDFPKYFQRDGLYSDSYHAYPDNAERFAFFAQAALHTAKAADFKPDIVHCNDWHTALTPYFMSIDDSGFFTTSRSVFTIHNGAYQGTHKFAEIPFLLPHYLLHSQLDGDALNFVRIGIRYANKINAVSPNYAQELLTLLGSHNLYQEFQNRRDDLSGILNGCDYSQWDPISDQHIKQNFSLEDMSGKKVCKANLQTEVGLPKKAKIPLIGMVCRLTEQKGFSYILPMIERLLAHNVQLLIIGTGDPQICQTLVGIANAHPEKFVFVEDFSVRKAHMLEAGSDFFLMPSLFEPCGLNQMYSLAFATLPIIRAVGGLKDTVTDLAEDPENATGFAFDAPDSEALLSCVQRALLAYHEDPKAFELMKQRAMKSRFTWEKAAQDYLSLYNEALN